jgi:predicted outer membrane protein
MSAPLKLRMGVVAAGLSCLVVGYALAQQVGEQQPLGQARDAAQPGQAGQIDQPATQQPGQPGQPYTAQFRGTQATAGQNEELKKFIASCLLSKNKAEVEFAQLAQRQSQNPQVKEFAQMLVQDHNQLVQKLQPIAGEQSTTQPGLSDTTRAPGQFDASRPGQIAAGGSDALHQLASLEKQIGERCKENLREELQSKQGAEFDKCYVGSQIAGHMDSVAKLEVLQHQGPDQVRQIAQQALPKVQEHLEQAKQLMKQLEGGGSTSTTNQAERQSSRTQR